MQIAFAGDEEDGGEEVFLGGLFLDYFAGFKTIHIRHFHIHENEVGLFTIIDFDGLKSIAGSDCVVIFLQDGVDEDNDGSGVIHNENFWPLFWLGIHDEASGFSKGFKKVRGQYKGRREKVNPVFKRFLSTGEGIMLQYGPNPNKFRSQKGVRSIRAIFHRF